MTRPVSIVLPSLDVFELFEANLPPLLEEVERRAVGDEVILVDDTGRDVLAERVSADFPTLVVIAREENGGFAAALLSGVERAGHDLVFSMNTDVRVRPRFLEPLVECLADEEVVAAVPLVFLNGDEHEIESTTELRFEDGLPVIIQEGLDSGVPPERVQPCPVAFAVGGAFLFRRVEFLERGGFDGLYQPFYWEDVDLGFAAWREGRRVVLQPASVVEHHHRGTIGELVPEEIFRASIERNRLLFSWKFLDDPALLRVHVATLYRMALDAWMGDERQNLIWLNLALEELETALAARRANKPAVRSFEEICAGARPDAT